MDHRPPTLEQVENAERVLAFIKEHPDRHEQAAWVCPIGWNPGIDGGDYRLFARWAEGHMAPGSAVTQFDCGTAGCFAGWLALKAGCGVYLAGGKMATPMVVLPGGTTRDLLSWAHEQIGVPQPRGAEFDIFCDYHAVFDEDNRVEDLSCWVQHIRWCYENNVPVGLTLPLGYEPQD